MEKQFTEQANAISVAFEWFAYVYVSVYKQRF